MASSHWVTLSEVSSREGMRKTSFFAAFSTASLPPGTFMVLQGPLWLHIGTRPVFVWTGVGVWWWQEITHMHVQLRRKAATVLLRINSQFGRVGPVKSSKGTPPHLGGLKGTSSNHKILLFQARSIYKRGWGFCKTLGFGVCWGVVIFLVKWILGVNRENKLSWWNWGWRLNE